MTMSACRIAPRIAPLPGPYETEIEAAFQRIMPAGMEPLKLFRTQAHNPRVLKRIFAANLLDKGSIPLRDRELIILRTCARCGSEYEWGVHVALFAKRAELDAATIVASQADASSHGQLAERDALIFKAVDELHASSDITDATWAALSDEFGSAQIVEIIALVGFYHTISFTTNALRIELEAFAPRFSDYASQ
jgi:alkylhydroperoxidase family enzyme